MMISWIPKPQSHCSHVQWYLHRYAVCKGLTEQKSLLSSSQADTVYFYFPTCYERGSLIQIYTVANNCHGESKSLTAKANRSRQKKIAHGKRKSLTAKANRSRRKQMAHGERKSLTAKANHSRKKQIAHGKSSKKGIMQSSGSAVYTLSATWKRCHSSWMNCGKQIGDEANFCSNCGKGRVFNLSSVDYCVSLKTIRSSVPALCYCRGTFCMTKYSLTGDGKIGLSWAFSRGQRTGRRPDVIVC